MKLTTDRCLIRNLTMEDAEDLYYVLSDERVMAYIEPAFDMERTKDFIRTAGLCEPPLVYAIVWKRTGKVIGHVIFHAYEPCDYEIGWIINRDYWGQGIADEVTKELIKYAKASGISSCIIECDTEQEASKHIALKNGFIYKGKRGKLEYYQLIL
ncbi:MAG: GNAT family N-acetyltransferase [Butyrivibrio sp.]|nr:GNAT family N-acetyltransferase [Acetatifactor muris]MCM1560926.1 GNAT family N-acetyltransferase [Butyrivibrio sp.]